MTLIEIMIALMIMAIVSLALVQSSLVAINANVINEMRDEAVSVAEQRMNEVRNTPWADLSSLPTTTPTIITRSIRTLTNFPYSTTLAMTTVNANTMQVVVTVTWTYRNNPYTHRTSTVMRNQ